MDRRQRKTRTSVFNAFISLLEEKDYGSITVQDIIDRADIGRATFYAHFKTKDDLLRALCNELFSHRAESLNHHDEGAGSEVRANIFLHLTVHIMRNDDSMLTLLSSENNDIFYSNFKEDMCGLVRELIDDGNLMCRSGLPESYLVNHVASTFVETINWWISNGKKETAEQLIDYFSKALEGVAVLRRN